MLRKTGLSIAALLMSIPPPRRYAPVKALRIVAAVLGAMCLSASASQVHIQAMAETAGNIQTVLKVKVLEVKHTRVHMKLKSGAQGPVTSVHADYKCQVVETVVGRWPTESKKVSIRFTSVVPIKYDENGKKVMGFSFIRPGSGMEGDLKKDKEYLACFAYHLDASKPLQHLYAAYRPEDCAGLLASVGDGKAFAKFIKALKVRLPDGWKISSTRYGKFRPLGGVGGSGIYIYIYDHKAPVVAGKRAPCNSYLFVRSLARFKVKAAIPYLIRWLRLRRSWEVMSDMYGEEASYLLPALDRIAGTRFGPPDQIGKREFYHCPPRSEVMPKVEKWWQANKDK